MKYFRMSGYINKCPKHQGFVGIDYDNYLHLTSVKGPAILIIGLYFFGIELQFGPKFGGDECA